MTSLSPLTCAEVFARLDDYVDRELSVAEQQQVEAHLAVCAACTREYRFEASVLEALKAKLRRIAVPPGLVARVTAALAQAWTGQDPPRPPASPPPPPA